MVKEFTDQNFKADVGGSKDLILIDFWAPWCGPCKVQGPIIEELAEEYKDTEGVSVGKMNVDENQATSQAHQIMSIPTLKFFKAGKVVAEIIGLQSKDAIKAKLEELRAQ